MPNFRQRRQNGFVSSHFTRRILKRGLAGQMRDRKETYLQVLQPVFTFGLEALFGSGFVMDNVLGNSGVGVR